MTGVTRIERYESNACIDREDAQAMSEHLTAIASALSRGRGRLRIDGRDQELSLHYARLVRVAQRCTQPNVVARAGVTGVDRIILSIENGVRTVTIRTQRADVILDTTARTVTLEERVIEIQPYLERRAS